MPKRRGRRSYSRTVARRARKAFSPSKAIIGGAGYAMLMPILTQKIPALNQPIIKMAGGYMLSKKAGVLGDIGKAALYIEIANMAAGMSTFNLGGNGAASTAYIS